MDERDEMRLERLERMQVAILEKLDRLEVGARPFPDPAEPMGAPVLPAAETRPDAGDRDTVRHSLFALALVVAVLVAAVWIGEALDIDDLVASLF